MEDNNEGSLVLREMYEKSKEIFRGVEFSGIEEHNSLNPDLGSFFVAGERIDIIDNDMFSVLCLFADVMDVYIKHIDGERKIVIEFNVFGMEA